MAFSRRSSSQMGPPTLRRPTTWHQLEINRIWDFHLCFLEGGRSCEWNSPVGCSHRNGVADLFPQVGRVAFTRFAAHGLQFTKAPGNHNEIELNQALINPNPSQFIERNISHINQMIHWLWTSQIGEFQWDSINGWNAVVSLIAVQQPIKWSNQMSLNVSINPVLPNSSSNFN